MSLVWQCLFLHNLAKSVQLSFRILVNLMGEKWCLCVVLTCIYLTLSKFQHLFTYLKVICISLSRKCLFVISSIFLPGFEFYYFWFLGTRLKRLVICLQISCKYIPFVICLLTLLMMFYTLQRKQPYFYVVKFIQIFCCFGICFIALRNSFLS